MAATGSAKDGGSNSKGFAFLVRRTGRRLLAAVAEVGADGLMDGPSASRLKLELERPVIEFVSACCDLAGANLSAISTIRELGDYLTSAAMWKSPVSIVCTDLTASAFIMVGLITGEVELADGVDFAMRMGMRKRAA